jgi:histidine triad (HIT) family protein
LKGLKGRKLIIKMECFFCGVLRKEVKVFDVYENENFLAFVDAFPFVFGQVVIVVKKHAFSFINFDEVFKDFLDAIKKLVIAFFSLGYEGYNLLINEGSASNFDHFYCILIPRKKDDGFSFNLKKLSLNQEEMEKISELIRKNIKQNEKEEKIKEEEIEEDIKKIFEKIKRIP